MLPELESALSWHVLRSGIGLTPLGPRCAVGGLASAVSAPSGTPGSGAALGATGADLVAVKSIDKASASAFCRKGIHVCITSFPWAPRHERPFRKEVPILAPDVCAPLVHRKGCQVIPTLLDPRYFYAARIGERHTFSMH